jgi:hypothetical protein
MLGIAKRLAAKRPIIQGVSAHATTDILVVTAPRRVRRPVVLEMAHHAVLTGCREDIATAGGAYPHATPCHGEERAHA